MKRELRKFPRIPATLTVKASVLSYPVSEEEDIKAISKNISQGGISFVSPVFYEPETPLSLKIFIPGWNEYKKPFSVLVDLSKDDFFTAIGKVVWCGKNGHNKEYEIGIKFINIYEDDYKALSAYIKKNCRSAGIG